MNSGEISGSFNPYSNINQNSMYYYGQQSQGYSLTPMEMNIIYLMNENRRLQMELFKQKEEAQIQIPPQIIQNQKITHVKVQSQSYEESSYSSGDSYIAPIKATQQTDATRKYLQNRRKKIKKNKGQKNQTKNIPKNYGKAITTFIENNKELVRRVISKFPSTTYNSFMTQLKSRKKRINSIADLRDFWLQSEDDDFPKITRIMSNVFLRYHSLEYIFNSRISNFAGHVKYRGRLVQAVKNPHHFTSIKQY